MLPFARQLLAGQAFTGMFLSPGCHHLLCPQVVDGEVYPPMVTEAPVHMVYPSGVPKEQQLAVGQEVFGLLPGLCVYATLWLREHNRVCDLLKRDHPTWSDEQLFQTARLILIGEEPAPPCPKPLAGPQGLTRWPASLFEADPLAAFWGSFVLVHIAKNWLWSIKNGREEADGCCSRCGEQLRCRAGGSCCCQLLLFSCPGETIKIVIEDYVQHLSGYYLSLKFDPELLFGSQFQYRNRIAVEFNQLYHWHGLMPDSFIIQGQEYSYKQFLYNTSMLMDYGVEALVESFSKQIAGRVRSCCALPASVGL